MLHRLTALVAPRPQTAEAWLVRMGRSRVSAHDRAGLLAWLEADPDHLRQYEEVKAVQAGLQGLRTDFAADLARLRRAGDERRSYPQRRWTIAGGVAVAALAAVLLLRPTLTATPERHLYRSAPGQITDVTLGDGSRVTLDAGSAIQVVLARGVRRVTLQQGAAYFEVAHAASHPFQVAVADRHVIVTGTRFVTALTGDGAEVSVLQGRVVLGRRDAAEQGALDGGVALTPGERAVFRPGEPGVHKTRADVESATAWRKRRLVFNEARLSDVIAAAARYADAPLIAADPRLDRIRVTAVLPLEGESALSDRMTALLPVQAERTPDGRILFRAE